MTIMKIQQTIYNLEPNKKFIEIAISKDDLGYRYYVRVNENYGSNSYVVFKNYIIGIFGYLSEKEAVCKIVAHFTSFEECVEDIKKLTPNKINRLFEKAPKNKILTAER